MHYQQNKVRLPTFEQRAETLIFLLHERGSVYHVLTREGALRTKHTRAEEVEFPAMSLFDREDHHYVSESATESSAYNWCQTLPRLMKMMRHRSTNSTNR